MASSRSSHAAVQLHRVLADEARRPPDRGLGRGDRPGAGRRFGVEVEHRQIGRGDGLFGVPCTCRPSGAAAPGNRRSADRTGAAAVLDGVSEHLLYRRRPRRTPPRRPRRGPAQRGCRVLGQHAAAGNRSRSTGPRRDGRRWSVAVHGDTRPAGRRSNSVRNSAMRCGAAPSVAAVIVGGWPVARRAATSAAPASPSRRARRFPASVSWGHHGRARGVAPAPPRRPRHRPAAAARPRPPRVPTNGSQSAPELLGDHHEFDCAPPIPPTDSGSVAPRIPSSSAKPARRRLPARAEFAAVRLFSGQ